MGGRHMAFPFRINADGRTAAPGSVEEHVRGEVTQLLLTNAGERPFLPSFGGGLRRLIFEKNTDAAAGLAKAGISQALGRWMGHRIEVQTLEVNADGATLAVDLSYKIIETGEEKRLRFQREL